ncbi:MAG: polysaccharide pyruvyl transferase family protein [Opitutales bacterium]
MGKKRNRIGVLTFHEVFNPGAFLQAYATTRLLRELGHEADIINYNTPAFRYHPAAHLWQLRHKLRTNYLTWLDSTRKDLAFRRARRRHFNLPDGKLSRKELAGVHYGAVIVGSDIVWNFQLRNDPAYFGVGLPGDRLVAFAPSCGNCRIEGEIPGYVGEGLARFHRLSARDERTSELVRRTTGRECPIVCDPTYHMAGHPVLQPTDKEPFILVYLLPGNTSEEMIQQVRKLSHDTGLPVHAVYYRHMWADRNIMSCDPFEWIRLISRAAFVVTNTFHGTLFSILTEANFVLEYSPLSEAKTRGVMTDCRLQERVFGQGSDLGLMKSARTDYAPARACMAERSRAARSYLQEALTDSVEPHC